MRDYIVIAVYEDNLQRYATTVKASSAEEAEIRAQAEAESPLIVAGVIDKATGDVVA
jgi:hypothetical protein